MTAGSRRGPRGELSKLGAHPIPPLTRTKVAKTAVPTPSASSRDSLRDAFYRLARRQP